MLRVKIRKADNGIGWYVFDIDTGLYLWKDSTWNRGTRNRVYTITGGLSLSPEEFKKIYPGYYNSRRHAIQILKKVASYYKDMDNVETS